MRVTKRKTVNKDLVVIGYARVSTLDQLNNTSLVEQKKQIEQFCKLNGYQLAEIITEQDSGRKVGRKGFIELIDKLDTNGFDGVVATKVDRLYRGIVAMGELFRKLEQKKKFIHTVDGVNTGQPQGKLLASVLGSFGELEADLIKARMRSGRMANADKYGKAGGKGKGRTGIAPFGYYYQEGELREDQEKLLKVKEAFNMFYKGWSMGVIARWLSQYYKTPRGNNFSPQGIRKMLNNSFYFGWFEYGDEQDYIIEKKHHRPLISSKIWRHSQARLKDRTKYDRKRMKLAEREIFTERL